MACNSDYSSDTNLISLQAEMSQPCRNIQPQPHSPRRAHAGNAISNQLLLDWINWDQQQAGVRPAPSATVELNDGRDHSRPDRTDTW
jgi:hypothetical protein